MRLDLYLFEKGYAETRSKASQLIKAKTVFVNDRLIEKNGYDVKDDDIVKVKENHVLEFVSRGGHKLEKAINAFELSFSDMVICDIGSSTGGFTDCSLKYGAKKVYAIDVGTSQLHPSLRNRNDVIVYENTNFKDVKTSLFAEKIDFYVCDVSFISIREIIKTLIKIEKEFRIILLFKPQFEVGADKLNKKGVVKKDEYLISALKDFKTYLKLNKLVVLHESFSPILGNKEGNIEFLFDIATSGKEKNTKDELLVSEAIKELRKA